MNEEIPYNPPGLDEYIREGARKNSALLRKMQGQPEPSATAEAKPDCAPRTGSASTCDEDNELIEQCLAVLRGDKQHAGVAILQRRLRLGYTRAARIMDELERRGNVGPAKGYEPRDVF